MDSDVTIVTKKTCSATKKDGSPCKAPATKATGKCAAHSGLGVCASPESARAGAEKVNAARRKKAQERAELRGMTLKDLLAARLEQRAETIVKRLERIIDTGNDSDSLRAIESMLARVYGKPTEHVVTETTDQSDMSLAELERERKRLSATLSATEQTGKESPYPVPIKPLEGLTARPEIEH